MDKTIKTESAAILKKTYPKLKPIYITILNGDPVIAATYDANDPFLTNHYIIDLKKKKAYTLAVPAVIDRLVEAVQKDCEEY